MTLLGPADFRKFQETGLDDTVLQVLLDAAEGAINRRLASGVGVTERYPTSAYDVSTGTYLGAVSSAFLYPTRPVSAITSITETVAGVVTTLAANDYRIWPGGWKIERLATGTNPRSAWTGMVDLVFASTVDIAERKRVQAELVKLDINHNPGLSSERIGDWEETYVDNSAMHYGLEREAILDTLRAGVAIA